MRTYLSNQENAKAFAEMAKGMAMQSHNTEHSDKIMETLDSAKTKGALNDEEYGTLVKAHAQQQIDGGAAAGAEADRDERRATPSSIRSAVQLSQEGAGSVKATESDAEGNLKSLEVVNEGGGATKYDVSIPGTLEPLRQDTPMACWATVATMMANWKNQAAQSVHEYIASIGAEWLPYIDAGLPLTKVTEFAGVAGIQYDAPNAQFPVSHYVDILERFGPIWVTDLESSDVALLHGRLVTAVHGDDSSVTTTFRIVDPMTGTTYDEDLPTFMAKTERVVETITAYADTTVPLLVYYKDAYQAAAFASTSSGSVSVGGSTSNQQRIRDSFRRRPTPSSLTAPKRERLRV